MREYPLQYASTDKNKKSHYNTFKIILGKTRGGAKRVLLGIWPPPHPCGTATDWKK